MEWDIQVIVPEADFEDMLGPAVSHEFFGEGTQHVFFTSVSNEGHIHEYWGKTFATEHGDLTAASGAPAGIGPLASHVVETERTQHVIYQSHDRHLYELWWRPGETPHAGN